MARKTENKKSADNYPLVAVDIGSSSIRVMAAREAENGKLQILGYQEDKTRVGSVEKGIVTQTSDIGATIKRLLLLLGNEIGLSSEETLDRAFVTVGGKLLQVKDVVVRRDLISRNYITDKLLEAMELECRTKIEARYPTMRVLSAVPYRYVLDGIEQDDAPATMQKAKKLDVIYNVFVGVREAEEKTEGSFARANKAIEEVWTRPEALAAALVTEDDEWDGCGIIDFGAQTTTLTICKSGRYLFNRVNPLGGQNITNDIKALKISAANAELLKTKYGQAATKYVTKTVNFSLRSTDNTDERVLLNTNELARIIQLRLYEIVAPLMNDLKQYEQDIKKVYITGNGTELQDLLPYLQEQTTLPIEFGSHDTWLVKETDEEYSAPKYSMLIGTLALAMDFRHNHKEGEVKKLSPIENVTSRLIKIFTPEDFEN